MKTLCTFLLSCGLLLMLCMGCHEALPEGEGEACVPTMVDSLDATARYRYLLDTNLELVDDSIRLACLPVMDCYITLNRGDRVVVAELAEHPTDSIETLWVKLARSEAQQGWLPLTQMKRSFVPTDSISQAIYLFSRTHASYFIAIWALFVVVWLLRKLFKEPMMMVYVNDIDSLYPLLLCLLMALSATLYASIQQFAPALWEQFYYNPTLSPLHTPWLISLFLASLWLIVLVLIAAIDDSFTQLSPLAALSYLLGLAAGCVCCYFFFMITTAWYVGYPCLLLLGWLFVRRARRSWRLSRYRCGRCGHPLTGPGLCSHCGALNR